MVPGQLKVLTQNMPEHEKMDLNPPSYFRQNELTQIFQDLTDTYGIPRYKEINPTLFVLNSFPFQFGVMFGDIFHGSLLFIFALVIILMDHKIKLGHYKWALLQASMWAMFMGWI